MRNPNRIIPTLETIRHAWECVPDWRLGQLIFNLASMCGYGDCFYLEDDKMEEIARFFTAESTYKNGKTMIVRKHFSNFQDAVDAALAECDGKNFEIRSNADKTCELIYDTPDTEETE